MTFIFLGVIKPILFSHLGFFHQASLQPDILIQGDESFQKFLLEMLHFCTVAQLHGRSDSFLGWFYLTLNSSPDVGPVVQPVTKVITTKKKCNWRNVRHVWECSVRCILSFVKSIGEEKNQSNILNKSLEISWNKVWLTTYIDLMLIPHLHWFLTVSAVIALVCLNIFW